MFDTPLPLFRTLALLGRWPCGIGNTLVQASSLDCPVWFPPPFLSLRSELVLIILALIDGPVHSPGRPSYSDVAAVILWVTYFFSDSENHNMTFKYSVFSV